MSVIYVKFIILLRPRQAPSQAAAGSADCRQTGRKSKTDRQMISLVVWDSQEIKLSSRRRSRSAGAGAAVGAIVIEADITLDHFLAIAAAAAHCRILVATGDAEHRVRIWSAESSRSRLRSRAVLTHTGRRSDVG